MFAKGYLNHREATILKVTEPHATVAASRDISPGEVIDEDSLVVTKIPARFIQPGAFSLPSEAAGRVATQAIRAGGHITAANARRVTETHSTSAIVPIGRRAVAIPLDDAASASGLIKPNDLVDVIATFDLGQEMSVRRTTLTIIENVPVLAVGNEIADSIPKPSIQSKGGLFSTSGMPTMSRTQATVTIAVTPAEAQVIAFAKESAALTVALRPFGDDEGNAHTQPTTIATITGGHDDLIPMKKGFREYKGR